MTPSPETSMFTKISVRLLPILFCCYLINYIDRVNISFAKLTMSASLGIGDAAYGFGAGLFFIGYFTCQVPSNLLLNRFGARRWIAVILFAWGLVSAGTALIHHQWQFYVIRFVLGATEAGFFPGVILYLTWWYPSAMRVRIIASFLTAIPVAGLLGGPLSGWIMQNFHGAGLHDWQWLFVMEGIPCLGMAFWVLKSLPNHPGDAPWLNDDERARIESTLAQEAALRAQGGAPDRARAVVGMPVVWLLCLLYFCTAMGLYGLSFWLPQIIKDLGWDGPLKIGLISAIPWLVAVIFMFFWGTNSDRHAERRLHAAGASMLAAAGFFLCGLLNHSWIGLAAVSLAAAGIMGLMAVQWALPSALLNGTAAAAGIAMINSFGNLGGFASPTLIGLITDRTGNHASGQYVTGAFLLFEALVLFSCRFLQPVHRPPARD